MTFTSFEVFQIKNGSKLSLMTTMTNSKKVALFLLFMIKGKCVINKLFPTAADISNSNVTRLIFQHIPESLIW